MPIVKLTRKISIGRVYRVVEETYDIPDRIPCKSDDGYLMEYDSSRNTYFCRCANCTNTVRGVDFVLAELARVRQESGEQDQ